MDIETIGLAEVRQMEGRNLDTSVDENTLAVGEKADGTFGVFKLFTAIQKAIDWITSIGGNKNFTGSLSVKSKEVATTESLNNALANYDGVPRKITFWRSDIDGYYIQHGTRVHVYIEMHTGTAIGDWESLTPNGAIPATENAFEIPNNGKASAAGIYIFANGSISNNGWGGIPAGEYIYDFIYDTESGLVSNNLLPIVMKSDIDIRALSYTNVSNGDLNECRDSGIYVMLDEDSCQNKPAPNIHNNIVITIPQGGTTDSSRGIQLFFSINNAEVYLRTWSGYNVFGGWIRLH